MRQGDEGLRKSNTFSVLKGREMKQQKNLTLLLSVSMVVLLVVSPRALAGPDLPDVGAGEWWAYFIDNQSDGIWPKSYLSCPPIFTYNVCNLTTDITPAAGVDGIRIVRQGADGANSDLWDLSAGNNGQDGIFGGWLIIPLSLPPVVKFAGPEVNFTGGAYCSV